MKVHAATATVALLLVASVAAAAPKPFDRIVAVVDEQIITLSEVQRRAKARLRGEKPTEEELAGIARDMLQRIIDERLVQRAAEDKHIEVSKEDVERAIAEVATSNQLTPAALMAEVEKQGMTQEGYREELRRQILAAKWEHLTLRGRVKEKPDDKGYAAALDAERRKELARLRKAHFVEVRP